MFCPQCGSAAEIHGDVLLCVATGSDFSSWVRRELETLVAEPGGDTEHLKVRYGSTWYCPADGEQITELDYQASCRSCGRSLSGGLLYNLIEFHDHPPRTP